ncbi:cytochrome c biogenesis protein CcsA [Pseudochryseolinea flava]|uniref:Heme exporter protein C n=1 Tax=Pseudochryseolinea flava TaxID=2059302 RepID=A0A364XZI0_9BACT|nr:cytochrome c biogenesis protein CcsA [Pseudochryseolinea flava]RAV99740.1 ABC transporter permease [Pseudochryseolinea flava]
MKKWLKVAAVVILIFVHFGGLIFMVPRREIVNETIRAVYFHVPMWFGMVYLFSASVYYSIRYLKKPSPDLDRKSVEYANIGLMFGILGILTGMIWAYYAWGDFWHGDPKQNGAAITLLVYLAYFVLRGSVDNEEQRARLSAVYNIFAFAAMVPLIFIIPRITDSLHPGNGGNPGFNQYDLDNRMRPIFYLSNIGWILIGVWLVSLRLRLNVLTEKINEIEDEKN